MINSYGYSVHKLLYRAEDGGMQNLKKREGLFPPVTIDLDTIGIGVVLVHVLDDFDINTSPNARFIQTLSMGALYSVNRHLAR